jgi:hypothetical protein
VVDLVCGRVELFGEGSEELALTGGTDRQVAEVLEQSAAPGSAVGGERGFHASGDGGSVGDSARRECSCQGSFRDDRGTLIGHLR